MNGHAMSRSELVQAISVEPLSFFYASLVYPSYRDSLLHFLALVRLRINSNTLVLAPSSLPLRLHLPNLPNEITHEIYDHLFHSLIETEKLKVLDKIGLCPCHGSCLSQRNPHRLTSLCPTLISQEDTHLKQIVPSPRWRVARWTELDSLREQYAGGELSSVFEGFEVATCSCDQCARRRRKLRDDDEEMGGVCWVDFIPSAPLSDCCFEEHSHNQAGTPMDEGGEQGDCERLGLERAFQLGNMFSQSEKKMKSLVSSFDLTLFAPPSSEHSSGGPDTASLSLRPALVGISSTPDVLPPPSAPYFNLANPSSSLAYARGWSDDEYNDQTDISYFHIPETRSLTESELARFEMLGRSFRLPKEEGVSMVFAEWDRGFEVGEGRRWKEGWAPSFVLVNKVVLSCSQQPDLPRWVE